jgi:crotonobetainyl-CoA:carnitine CoA-transferase CaiB-like acyl-CoA transferase
MPYEFQEAQFPAKKRRPVYPPVRTGDGFLMIAPVNPRNFETLIETIGRSDWRNDPMLATEEARQAQWAKVMEIVEAWTSERSTEECARIFSQAGVPATAYRTVREAITDPQFAQRGSFAKVHDAGGEFLVPNLPFRMSGARVEAGAEIPELGQHTGDVLRDVLGAGEEQISRVAGAPGKSVKA